MWRVAVKETLAFPQVISRCASGDRALFKTRTSIAIVVFRRRLHGLSEVNCTETVFDLKAAT
jgi:hypothetical protein